MRPGLRDLRVKARHAPGWIFDQTLVARIACCRSMLRLELRRDPG